MAALTFVGGRGSYLLGLWMLLVPALRNSWAAHLSRGETQQQQDSDGPLGLRGRVFSASGVLPAGAVQGWQSQEVQVACSL